MKWENILKVALRSLSRNRMRSLLTALGIIIGVAAVIVMVAVGQGSQARIEANIRQLGANVIMVHGGASRAGGVSRGVGSMVRLTLDDADKLAREATLCMAVSPVVSSGEQVIGGGGNWNTQINGVSPEYLTIRAWELAAGEFFTERDVRARRKVAVLGKTVADELFPGQDPVAERIRIRNTPFKVIGVLAEKGQSGMGPDQDDVILAPSTTVLYRLSGDRHIRRIMASAISEEQIERAQEEVTELLREAHRIGPGEEDDFRVGNQAEIIEAVSETSKVLTILLGSIAGVSLVVGGIGIMNIMLVSVTERTREIGIRLAVGARGRDVLTQFLVEAVVLSLTGGIIGVLLSLGVAFALEWAAGVATVVNPGIVLLAFSFSGAVGVFFGFYPARKASALNPIDALRHD